ncbi:prohead protease/major capsid protein fusion protein [Aureimonas glaciei]|uniref:Prohead serine protease domain-containing protein n=1 Tax=Aureimonas glaciei TaxID=1776957 RepID=A0A916XUB1_9HYPH|nr:prohead protease/major capsid protein fusion protein [Aureimonas glaciei]GGD12053.1 hypothetical protein GCM10011335_13700 [Aureimonas glaciei]
MTELLHRDMPVHGPFEAMTIQAVVATDHPVARTDARGSFDEVLDPAGLRLTDDMDVPLLDSHDRRRVSATIGRASRFSRDGSAIVASLRFSTAPDVAGIVHRVQDGTLFSFSAGYRVARWAESSVNGRRTRTALDWQIEEVSIVAIGADPKAKRRSSDVDELDTIDTMPEADQHQIRTLAAAVGMTRGWAEDAIDEGLTIEEARDRAREAISPRPLRIRAHAGPSQDDPAAIRVRMEEALYCRTSGDTPSDAARGYMDTSLIDMGRSMLEARGTTTRNMDRDTIIRSAHTTGDFPLLLTGVGNRTVMAAYETASSPLRTTLSRRTTMVDFRTGTRLKVSGIGALEKVAENGEIRSATRGEAAESFKLDTHASIFSLTRQAFINDDLGVFRDWNVLAGRAAAETEANLLVALLASNPVMGEDGKRLFSADHGNLGAAAALDLGALADARLAMRKTKGLDRKTPIGVTPAFLLVGPENEFAAEQVLAEINPATVGDANPFTRRLQLLVEPRITGKEWYVMASPASYPVLEHAYLSSAPGPQMSSRDGWDVLATEFRVVLDFGAGVVDWRGAYKNPGL